MVDILLIIIIIHPSLLRAHYYARVRHLTSESDWFCKHRQQRQQRQIHVTKIKITPNPIAITLREFYESARRQQQQQHISKISIGMPFIQISYRNGV